MKKFKRKIKFKVLPKILFVVSCFALVFAFAFSSHASSYNPDTGNLTSDNIYNVNADSYKYLYNSWSGSSPSSSNATTVTLTDTGFTATGGGGNFVYYGIPVAFNTGTYKITCSLANTRRCGFTLLDRTTNSILYRNENITSNSFSTTVTITDSSHSYYVGFALFVESSYTQTFSDIMVYDSDLTLTSYEPYGVEWYSSTQYENYGSSKYSEGYNKGVSDTLDSLSNMEIGYLRSGVGLGVYDSTNTSLLYRGTLTDVETVGTGVHLYWSADKDLNVYYRLVFDWNDNYILKNIKWTPNRFNPSTVYLTYGTNVIRNVNYDGHYYGFFDLDQNDVSGYNEFTLNFKLSSANWEGFNLYVDALNLNLADSQALAESNYNNGYQVGYEKGYSESYNLGYSDAVANIKDANANYKTLIWTIASTPWESFKHIWSFDILGLNVANIVIGFIMVLLLIYIIKKIWR